MSETPAGETDARAQVLAENRDGVLLLKLNRPDRLNAWNPAMEKRLFDLMAAADGDPEGLDSHRQKRPPRFAGLPPHR